MKFPIAFTLLLLLSLPVFGYDDIATAKDVAEWKALAEKGDAEAQYNLAEALRKGEGVEADEKEASKWYQRSANQGYAEAQFAMGFVYRGGGNGFPMDKVMSYTWFYLASKNGETRALGMLNDIAWGMSEAEIKEGRRKADDWTPEIENQKRHHAKQSDEPNN